MKNFNNVVVNIEKSGIVYRKSDGKLDSVVKVTTEDGITSEVTRRNATKGGYRAGSNYAGDEKCLRTASLLCEGVDLMSALRQNYAKCGVSRDGLAWASEYFFKVEGGILYRMSKTSKHQTNGWAPAYNVSGKYPQEILQDFNNGGKTRTVTKGYKTTGDENNRNANITEAKRKEGLKKA